MKPQTTNNDPIHPLLWLWIPAATFIIFIVLELFLPKAYYGLYINEGGVVETAHGLIMMIGAVLAYLNLRQLKLKEHPWLGAWFGAALLGCIYIAGEEISWGQHIIGWSTPEYWQMINDQQETNLHNTSSWLDQKPRLMLEIGIIVGGLLLPLTLRFAPGRVPDWLKIITPPNKMALCALIFLIIKIFDKVGDHTDFQFFKRPSELTEFYLHYFIMLYLWASLYRFRKPKPQ